MSDLPIRMPTVQLFDQRVVRFASWFSPSATSSQGCKKVRRLVTRSYRAMPKTAPTIFLPLNEQTPVPCVLLLITLMGVFLLLNATRNTRSIFSHDEVFLQSWYQLRPMYQCRSITYKLVIKPFTFQLKKIRQFACLAMISTDKPFVDSPSHNKGQGWPVRRASATILQKQITQEPSLNIFP